MSIELTGSASIKRKGLAFKVGCERTETHRSQGTLTPAIQVRQWGPRGHRQNRGKGFPQTLVESELLCKILIVHVNCMEVEEASTGLKSGTTGSGGT